MESSTLDRIEGTRPLLLNRRQAPPKMVMSPDCRVFGDDAADRGIRSSSDEQTETEVMQDKKLSQGIRQGSPTP
jgi:hypothetical protein